MVGNVIVGYIFKAIKAPFEVGSDVVSTVDSAADAIDHIASASNNFASAAKEIKQVTADTASQVTEAVKTINSALTKSEGAKERQHDTLHAAILSSAPLPDLGLVADYKKKRVGTKLLESHSNNRTVKFGDNSVTMIGVQDRRAYAHNVPDHNATPNMWQRGVQMTHTWAETFATNANHDCILQSQLAWYTGVGEQRNVIVAPSTITHGVLNPVEAQHVQFPTVTYTTSIRLAEVAETATAELKTANQINDRTVANVLNGMLHPANANILRDVAFKLGEPIFFYDNVM